MKNLFKPSENYKNLIQDALQQKNKKAFKYIILKANKKDFLEGVYQAASLELFDFIIDFLPLENKKANSLMLEGVTNSKQDHVKIVEKLISHCDLFSLENAMINCSKMGHADSLRVIMEKSKDNEKLNNAIAHCMTVGAKEGHVEVLKIVGEYINPKLMGPGPLYQAIYNDHLKSVEFIISFLKKKDYDVYMGSIEYGINIASADKKNKIFDFLIKENVRTLSLKKALWMGMNSDNKHVIDKVCMKLSLDVINEVYDEYFNERGVRSAISRDGCRYFIQIRKSIIDKKNLNENIKNNNKQIKKRVI